MYVNNAFAATSGAFDLADDVSLANGDGYLGIGECNPVYASAQDVTHTIDNVTLISGAMTDKNVLALRNI